MKKQTLFIAALFCAATTIKAQMLPMGGGGMQPMGAPMPQPWTTDLMTVPSGIHANLGTTGGNSLNFFTAGNKQVEINKLGKVKVLGLSDSASIPDLRFLFVDRDGFLTTSTNRPVPTETLNCGEGATPWLLGGNNPSSSGVGFDGRPISDPFTIGTCSDNMFALKSHNKNFVFINPNGSVGVGEDNMNTTATLDISSPVTSGQRHHLKIYGDEDGTIEATQNMHLYYDSNSSFVISRGSLNDVDANMIEMYPQLGISLNDNTTVAGNESIYGNATVGGNAAVAGNFNINTNKFSVAASNGKTIIGNQAGTSNNAMMNINVLGNASSAVDAINVYDGYTWQNNFRVQSDGKTHFGNPTNAPNSSKVNINVGGITSSAVNALEIYDGYSNAVNFLVKSNGVAYSREVIVKLGSYPDYVFNKDYNLESLENLETYIKQNKHLPGVPTAKEIEKNGASVGELCRIQMEKIEELTLYVIQLKKESDVLKAELQALKAKK